MSTESEQALKTKIGELENVHRIASNALSVIGDSDIKGAYALPVGEVINWLNSFKTSLMSQITTLKDALPKPEAKAVVEAEEVPTKVVA